MVFISGGMLESFKEYLTVLQAEKLQANSKKQKAVKSNRFDNSLFSILIISSFQKSLICKPKQSLVLQILNIIFF